MKNGIVAVLAVMMVTCVSCGLSKEPGSISFSLSWQEPPEQVLWILIQVEERETPELPGTILASTGPADYTYDEPFSLSMPEVANGTNRVIVVEAREGADTSLPVLYYGVSEPFSIEVGKNVHIDIPLELRKPQTEMHEPKVELLFDGEVLPRAGPEHVIDATILTRSVGAAALVLANDASFSANLVTISLDDAGAVECTTEPEGDIEWQVCVLTGWDLTAGLPDEMVQDGLLTVFAKLVDALGYESGVKQTSVVFDSTAPIVLTSSVTPSEAAAGQTVLLSATFHEALSDKPQDVVLHVVPAGGPTFAGPDRIGESNSYVWTATVGELGQVDQATYTFVVEAPDSLGNVQADQPLVDHQGQPVSLHTDSTAPALVAQELLTYSQALFGIPDEAQKQSLTFDFILQESNAHDLTSAENGICQGTCPEIRLAGSMVGSVLRNEELDNLSVSRIGFRYEYQVDAETWGNVDMELPLSVSWSDKAGNVMLVELPEKIRLDFVRPTATNCLLTPEYANAASTITYAVTVSEPLLEEPALVQGEGQEALFAAPPEVGAGGFAYTWQQGAATVANPKITLSAELIDLAGNSSDGAVCENDINVDSAPPVLVSGVVETAPVVLNSSSDVVVAAGDGDTLLATVEVSENQGLAEGFPQMLLDVPAAPLDFTLTQHFPHPELDDVEIYEFALVLSATDNGAEGIWPIRVTLQDLAGNLLVVSKVGDLLATVDFTPPAADCSLIPPAPDAGYAIGSKVILQVSPFEALEPGTLPVVTENHSAPIGTEHLLVYDEGTEYRFTGIVPETGIYSDFEAIVTLRDLVGNETPLDQTACIGGIVAGAMDGQPPGLASAVLLAGDPPVEVGTDDFFKFGDKLTAVIELTGTQVKPTVKLGNREMTATTDQPFDWDGAIATWEFSLQLDGSEGHGLQPVGLASYDEAGNYFALAAVGVAANLDFIWPEAVCSVTPSPAGLGDFVTLTISTTEPLQGGLPVVNDDLGLEAPAPDPDATSFVFTHLVSKDDEEKEQWTYDVALTDLAGNENEGPWGCSGTAELDYWPPEVAQGVYVSATHATDQEKIVVAFDLVGESGLQGEPDVSVGTTKLAADPGAWNAQFVFSHFIDSQGDSLDVEGVWPVSIALADTAGNQSFHSPGTVTYDFGEPSLIGEVDLVLQAPQDCRLLEVQALTTGSGMQLSFSVDEVLVATPEPYFTGQSIETCYLANNDTPGPYQTSFNYYWKDGLNDCALPAGIEDNLMLAVELEDLAGNKSTIPLGTVAVDTIPPLPPAVTAPGMIQYTRIPWGVDATGGAKAWLARGGQGAVEALGHVIVLDGENQAVAGELGRTVADEQGTFGGEPGSGEEFYLLPPDRMEIYLTVYDAACNPHGPAAVVVRDMELLISMGFKEPGSTFVNPHVLETRRWLHNSLFESGSPEAQPWGEGEGPSGDSTLGGIVEVTGAADWEQWNHSVTPIPARSARAAAYDSLRRRLIVFGGQAVAATVYGDTWEWDGESWWEIEPEDEEGDGNPTARKEAAAAFDEMRGKVVLFGGRPDWEPTDELWEWDGRNWLARIPCDPEADGNPQRRSGHAMAYAEQLGGVLAFGGSPDPGNDYESMLNDLWLWDGYSWKLMELPPGNEPPSTRWMTAAAWDSVRQRLVVFGGTVSSGHSEQHDEANVLGDTWEWDGTSWTRMEPQNSPSKAYSVTMGFDGERVLLFGGKRPGYSDFHDGLWAWDGQDWERIDPDQPDAPEPDARSNGVLVMDAARGVPLLFGGWNKSNFFYDDVFADVWQWEAGAWQELLNPAQLDEARPPKASKAQMVYDSGSDLMWLYGGELGNDGPVMWSWDGRRWEKHNLGDGDLVDSPQNYCPSQLVYDEVRGHVLTFGAGNGAADADGTWAWNGIEWQLIVPLDPEGDGNPPPRQKHGLAYDPVRERIVLFGGKGEDTIYGDTWEWNGESWQEITPDDPEGDGNPEPRYNQRMVYDPNSGGIFLQQGRSEQGQPEHMYWVWNGTSWRWLEPVDPEMDGEPGFGQHDNCYSHEIAFDTDRQRVQMLADGGSLDVLWEWDGESWARRTAGDANQDGSPAYAEFRALAYDQGRGELLAFGGDEGGTSDRLYRRFAATNQRPAVVMIASLAGAGVSVQEVTTVTARFAAGGDGEQAGEDSPGASLLVWLGGGFVSVDEHQLGRETPGELTWTTSDQDQITAMATGELELLGFAATPSYPNGLDYGQLRVTAAEVLVSYLRIPGDSEDCENCPPDEEED